jgi:hypothetical protein
VRNNETIEISHIHHYNFTKRRTRTFKPNQHESFALNEGTKSLRFLMA